MNHLKIHCGIIDLGLQAAGSTLETVQHSARVVRDGAAPDSDGKAAMRYIAQRLSEAETLVRQAQARFDDLQNGDGCATSNKAGT